MFSSDRSRSGHVTRQSAWLWIKDAAKTAGVNLDGCSPHALRKSYAVELRRSSGVAAAQAALQHDRASTTAIYAFADVYGGKGGEPVLWSQVDELAELVAAKLAERAKKPSKKKVLSYQHLFHSHHGAGLRGGSACGVASSRATVGSMSTTYDSRSWRGVTG